MTKRAMERLRSSTLANWLGSSERALYVALLASIGCRDTTAASGGVREKWYQFQSGYGYARPAIAGRTAIFGTGDGRIIARDRATGAPIWSTKVAASWIGGANMAVRGNVVVVPVVQETVALDASTGRELWRYLAPADTVGRGGAPAPPGQVFRTHLDADSETVYIPAWGASVSAVDIATGAVRWVWRPGPSPTDTAASGVFRSGSSGVRLSGDTVYAAVWHGRDAALLASEAWLVALDRGTGRELWRVVMPSYTGGAFVGGAPAVAGQLVIFESNGGHEYGVNRMTGQLAWEFSPQTANATDAETEVYDGVAYHDGGDQYIYALRATDGSLVWRAPFSSMTSADLLITPRRVIFSDARTLYILDRATGAQIARVEQPRTTDSFFASPASFAEGQVFVTVGDGAWSFYEP